MHHLINTPKTHLISSWSMTHSDEIDYHLKWMVKTSKTRRSLWTYKRFKNDGDKTGRSWNNKPLWTVFRKLDVLKLDGLIMGGLKLDGLKLDSLKPDGPSGRSCPETEWSKTGRSQIGRSQIGWSQTGQSQTGQSQIWWPNLDGHLQLNLFDLNYKKFSWNFHEIQPIHE